MKLIFNFVIMYCLNLERKLLREKDKEEFAIYHYI